MFDNRHNSNIFKKMTWMHFGFLWKKIVNAKKNPAPRKWNLASHEVKCRPLQLGGVWPTPTNPGSDGPKIGSKEFWCNFQNGQKSWRTRGRGWGDPSHQSKRQKERGRLNSFWNRSSQMIGDYHISLGNDLIRSDLIDVSDGRKGVFSKSTGQNDKPASTSPKCDRVPPHLKTRPHRGSNHDALQAVASLATVECPRWTCNS